VSLSGLLLPRFGLEFGIVLNFIGGYSRDD
jgi:hypothetical protein